MSRDAMTIRRQWWSVGGVAQLSQRGGCYHIDFKRGFERWTFTLPSEESAVVEALIRFSGNNDRAMVAGLYELVTKHQQAADESALTMKRHWLSTMRRFGVT